MTDLNDKRECIISMLQINDVKQTGVYLHVAYSGICS